MSEFRINIRQARNEMETCRALSRSLGSMQNDLNKILHSLDFSILRRERIRKRMEMQEEAIKQEQQMIKQVAASLQEILRCYERTENGLCGLKDRKISYEGVVPTSTSWYEQLQKMISKVSDRKDILSIVKALLKGYDKYGDNDEAGVLKDMISYIEDFAAFFGGDKRGLTGASALCDLTKSSIAAWTGIYDYYKDKYENAMVGMFSELGQRYVKVAGLSGSCFGLFSSLLSATDGIGKKNLPSIIADYMDAGKDVVSIIKSGYELKHIGDVTSLSKIKAGPWSALSIYTSIVKAGVDTGSQALRSYEKYYADGKWDLGDTAATMIDVSMSGLYSLCHSLSFGLDDLVFGAIEDAFGTRGKSDLNYFEQAAEGYKIVGRRVANKIAGWIMNLRK